MDIEVLETLDAAVLRRWCRAALDALAGAREQIDALNVYPVPDRDTGTNLYLTMRAASQAVDELPASADLAAILHALSRGALIGARGNSGGILSQLLAGLSDTLAPARGAGGASPSAGGADARALAAAYRRAADLAYAAVAQPVEGTMLTVARAAARATGAHGAEGDDAAAEPGGRAGPAEQDASIRGLAEVARGAAEGARRALARTPAQLEVLARAGVVDAGGQGLCVLYDALARVLETSPTGTQTGTGTATGIGTATGTGLGVETGIETMAAVPDLPQAGVADLLTPDRPVGVDGPAYEVTYLLDAPEGKAAGLRSALDRLGDSVLVGGGDGLWTVHAHVDDVGAAVEAGLSAGRPHRIRVTPLVALGADVGPEARTPRRDDADPAAATRGVVCVVAGEGLAALCQGAGAVTLLAAPGSPVSAEKLLEGIRRTEAREVVVLPNDAGSLTAARAASLRAQGDGLRVAVLPIRASVQALAALAVHEPSRPFDEDVVAMTSAAGHARSGAVTLAHHDAVTTAGPCKAGDALGIIDRDFAIVDVDLGRAACAVLDRMLAAGGELVTVVTGAGADASLVRTVVEHVATTHPEVDSTVHHGGQARYPLLLGVE